MQIVGGYGVHAVAWAVNQCIRFTPVQHCSYYDFFCFFFLFILFHYLCVVIFNEWRILRLLKERANGLLNIKLDNKKQTELIRLQHKK